jgi:hypothetical protein
VSKPFTISVFRPASFKRLGSVNPVTGALQSVPRNRFKVLVRKGVLPLADQPSEPALIEFTINVPAGSDTADEANLRAMLSSGIGFVADQADEIAGMCLNGVL